MLLNIRDQTLILELFIYPLHTYVGYQHMVSSGTLTFLLVTCKRILQIQLDLHPHRILESE